MEERSSDWMPRWLATMPYDLLEMMIDEYVKKGEMCNPLMLLLDEKLRRNEIY